jgi:hypothetical protein
LYRLLILIDLLTPVLKWIYLKIKVKLGKMILNRIEDDDDDDDDKMNPQSSSHYN